MILKKLLLQPEPDTTQLNLPPSPFSVMQPISLTHRNVGFRSHEGIQIERKDTLIPGEPPSRGGKPVRILNNFTFFLHRQNLFAELDDLAHDSYNMAFEVIGEAFAIHDGEIPDEEEDVDEPILLHLTPIINASIDYEKYNEYVVSPFSSR